jgi:hypothetical protein
MRANTLTRQPHSIQNTIAEEATMTTDDRAHGECTACSYGFSGDTVWVENKADDHESETGHKVVINYDL